MNSCARSPRLLGLSPGTKSPRWRWPRWGRSASPGDKTNCAQVWCLRNSCFSDTTLEFQKLRPDAVRVGVQDGHGAREIEARLAGVTGIEIKRAANRLAKRLVRVAEDNYFRSLANDAALDGLGRFARVNDVMHEEFVAIEFYHFRFLEIEGGVVVAEHGGHRRDPLQLEDQPRQSDVAGVQDMVDAREELRNLR